jgi:hypothetical protein
MATPSLSGVVWSQDRVQDQQHPRWAPFPRDFSSGFIHFLPLTPLVLRSLGDIGGWIETYG